MLFSSLRKFECTETDGRTTDLYMQFKYGRNKINHVLRTR